MEAAFPDECSLMHGKEWSWSGKVGKGGRARAGERAGCTAEMDVDHFHIHGPGGNGGPVEAGASWMHGPHGCMGLVEAGASWMHGPRGGRGHVEAGAPWIWGLASGYKAR